MNVVQSGHKRPPKEVPVLLGVLSFRADQTQDSYPFPLSIHLQTKYATMLATTERMNVVKSNPGHLLSVTRIEMGNKGIIP